ncbi:phosphate ABC transporter, permease protein PstC [Candidatus Magnetoovum chiemensis]|nr:phosphate ABC transporter, permease protein PstC [Candidatus Magnetoovum chiemensis]
MKGFNLIGIIGFLSITSFYFGRLRCRSLVKGKISDLHSLPSYYGLYVALWCGIPSLLLFGFWLTLEDTIITKLVVSSLPQEVRSMPADRMSLIVNDIKNLASGNIVSSEPDEHILAASKYFRHLISNSYMMLLSIILSICIAGFVFGLRYITPDLRARNKVEIVVKVLLIACSLVAIITTIGIVLSVLFEAVRFFNKIPIFDFLFGLQWSPQIALRADQVASSGSFGIIPLMTGTLMISLIAMAVAVPIGLMSAVYMSEYATERFRAAAKPILEILAGIPTVVYGFFAAIVVAPFIRDLGGLVGIGISSESALAAGLVMGIMVIPFVSSLSDDVINAVPQSLRDGSYALGATNSETIIKVILPAALPGIVGSILLAISRAIGETMIVVMAAGLTANLTANPLQSVTTVTVQIVTLLIGDQEFDSPKTLAAFALGLVLFIVTLCLNVIALYVVRKYREQYE